MINSILDDDIYKFYMMNAITKLYPDTVVIYKFKNRGKHRFNQEFLNQFDDFMKNQIEHIVMTDEEVKWLRKTCPFFTPDYISFLKDYRFNPNEVAYSLDEENNLVLEINGLWNSTIMWEIVLMAAISEIYFKTVDTNWNHDLEDYRQRTYDKFSRLFDANVTIADFGTRRRRSAEVQDIVVETGKNFPNFIGTSNPYLAMKYGVRPIGTQAHEWICGISALESLNHPNRLAMQKWAEVYHGELGIALTDTYGTDSFLKDFDVYYAKLFDGVRHDSGSPYEFCNKILDHYKKLGINPMLKTAVFSDGLDVDTCIKINEYCKNKIRCSFGCGTHLTNDFLNSPALNMVIKLHKVNDFFVVKLSDNPGKEMGEAKSLEMHKWLFGR